MIINEIPIKLFGYGIVIGTTLLVIFIIGLVCFLAVSFYNGKYIDFINEHSLSLKKLKEINKRYVFKKIDEMYFSNTYDNGDFYNEISCKDYLTYVLVDEKFEVERKLKDSLSNLGVYNLYLKEIKEKCILNAYDVEITLKNKDKLIKTEKEMFEKAKLKPDIDVLITIKLIQTDINGKYLSSKTALFSAKDIKWIINGLNNKRGNFYLDRETWNSLCRVERGKVSNKMRFAIYKRDGYRCRYCGRTENMVKLEVDHIKPISKGGKSIYNNLQTLCRDCNYEKGSN